MAEIPERRMPEFKIGTEQIENLKTVSAVTKVLAENPALTEEIAEIFKQIAMEKEKELVERVTAVLADKVEIPQDKLKAAFWYWYIWYFPPEPRKILYNYPYIHWR